MNYRLGLDLGTNSIGWWVLPLAPGNEPEAVGRGGVRIFPDGRNPKDGTSLASARRLARGARRRRDRMLLRKEDLMDALVVAGLMPDDPAERKALEVLDPYELRATALDNPLPAPHVGRALFHLHQRRGFLSNRRTDRDEKEAGTVKKAIGELRRRKEESRARTLGEYLWRRRQKGKVTRAAAGKGTGLYPARDLVREEFDAIRIAQAPHHAAVSEDDWASIEAIIFRQRPLRPVDPGICTLDDGDPTEARAPLALPYAQLFRIVQELANLRHYHPGGTETALSLDQRDLLLRELRRRPKLTFKRIAILLKLDGDTKFNLASEKRDHLIGDRTATAMAREGRFGPAWHDLSLEQQTVIVETLLDESLSEEEIARRAREDWRLDAEAAEAIAEAPLPAGYGRLGRKALQRVSNVLLAHATFADANGEIRPMTFDKAVILAGYPDHRLAEGDGGRSRLPYYGAPLWRHVVGGGAKNGNAVDRFGRLPNPTVHIALNQLRRVVNTIIEQYGKPAEIAIELARELKLTKDGRDEVNRRQALESKRNERLRKVLEENGRNPDSAEDLRRLKLWEELSPRPDDRCCPYSGKPIGIAQLLSDLVEIDHILPFAISLDDSMANRTVCFREANRDKSRRTPFDAFHTNPKNYDYQAILTRADKMPPNKRWRFGPDAAQRFGTERGFLDRQLNETRYISRMALAYLKEICSDVWVTPGQLTALLRGKWGLNGLLGDHNRKSRNDHRHHAIDAFVVALTTRSTLLRIATAAERSSRERLIDDMPQPFASFSLDLMRKALETIVVSHKADRPQVSSDPKAGHARTSGRFHNDTAYGLVGAPDTKGYQTVVLRKPLSQLGPETLDAIRDVGLRRRLGELWAEMKADGRKWPEFAAAAAVPGRISRFGVTTIRVTERMQGLIAIRNESGDAFKAYKADANDRVEVYADAKGRWKFEVVSTFDANRKDFEPAWRADAGARALFTLYKDDMLSLNAEGGGHRLARVVKFSGGTVVLADHKEAGALKKRDADPEDPFKYLNTSGSRLQALNARPVEVDPAGKVRPRRVG